MRRAMCYIRNSIAIKREFCAHARLEFLMNVERCMVWFKWVFEGGREGQNGRGTIVLFNRREIPDIVCLLMK